MRTPLRRAGVTATAMALSALAFGVASSVMPAAAKIAAGRPAAAEPPTASAPAFPTFVELPADQAAHRDLAQEWWYVVGHVKAPGHQFGYEVQIVGGEAPAAVISITDQTTGRFYTDSQTYAPDQGSFSTTGLDARVPSATLSGPIDAMHLHATLPAGEINLTLDAQGPAEYNNGTGLMPFLGGTSYYYSLPSLASEGTVTADHHMYAVAGQSWLDHQWGDWDWTTVQKWTWMPIQLSNGDELNLWDMFSREGHVHYATVLHPDGTEAVVSVNPLAATTSNLWTSPTTGKRYGTEWTVQIPALDASLDVVARPQGQEVQAYGGVFEGAGSVTGTYRGKPITGRAYVEQLGDWR
jgi:predicted secreted hydrolase